MVWQIWIPARKLPHQFIWPWTTENWIWKLSRASGHRTIKLNLQWHWTHVKQVVDCAVRVVETRPQRTNDLVTLEPHRHNLQNGLFIRFPSHQQTLGFRQWPSWVRTNRRRRSSRLSCHRCRCRRCSSPWRRRNSLRHRRLWLRLCRRCFRWGCFGCFWLRLNIAQLDTMFNRLIFTYYILACTVHNNDDDDDTNNN